MRPYRSTVARRVFVDQHVKRAVGDGLPRTLRYLLVGGMAWVIDIAVFALCVTGVGVASAQLLARLSGAIVAFFGHKVFVFGEDSLEPATVARQALRYVSLWVLSVTISTLALIGLIDHAGVHALSAKVAVESAMVAMNYLVMRSVVFRPADARKG
jgi:putative flippase GtrA